MKKTKNPQSAKSAKKIVVEDENDELLDADKDTPGELNL